MPLGTFARLERFSAARLAAAQVHEEIPFAANVASFLSLPNASMLGSTLNYDVYGPLAPKIQEILKHPVPAEEKNIRIFEANHQASKEHQVGNCMDQARAAFALLYRRNVRPLDIVGVPMGEKWRRQGETNHYFVAIGAPSPIGSMAAWDDDIAIVDPWTSFYVEAARDGKEGESSECFTHGVFGAASYLALASREQIVGEDAPQSCFRVG